MEGLDLEPKSSPDATPPQTSDRSMEGQQGEMADTEILCDSQVQRLDTEFRILRIVSSQNRYIGFRA